MATFFYVLIAFAVGFGLGRYRSYAFQNRGEGLVAKGLMVNFSSSDYHLMNSVTVQMSDGTTQIDHILISRFGIFVIETKHYKGWIFANPKHPTWTQVIYKQKFKFQNPIYQNQRHIRAVQLLLNFLPASGINSAVVFTGDAEFKTPLPSGVFRLNALLAHLRLQTQPLLSAQQMELCIGRLEANRLTLTKQTDVDHVQSLQRRHGYTE